MRRIMPPLAVAILALAAGCADTTSPATRTALSASALIGNPPPPPSDTSGSYRPNGAFGALNLRVVYFLNPTEKAGFIHFNTDQPAGVTISPNASINYHLGTITGAGMITGVTDGGTVRIDLSQVASKGFFNPTCGGVIDERGGFCASVSAPATITDAAGNVTTTDGQFIVGTTPIT